MKLQTDRSEQSAASLSQAAQRELEQQPAPAGNHGGPSAPNLRQTSQDSEHAGKDLIDVFCATAFQAGEELLQIMDQNHVETDRELRSKAESYLQALEGYQFKIAFAGEQSCGKSSLINSLLDYPLMPTCLLVTTCVGTTLIYGKSPRIIVHDDDTGKRIVDIDCAKVQERLFKALKNYACHVSGIKLVENLQYFTDRNLLKAAELYRPELADELEMDPRNPNHVIVLLMILLTVYVDQNNPDITWTEECSRVNAERAALLAQFGFPSETVNYSITLQWNGEFLKSGMTIIDLPGLGANAPDKDIEGKNGRTVLGHNSITAKVLANTADAMVLLTLPTVTAGASAALAAMLSNASLKDRQSNGDFIVPVLNKIDLCAGPVQVEQAVAAFKTLISQAGIQKKTKDIWPCSTWYGEAKFTEFPIERTLLYKRKFQATYEDVADDEDSYGLSERELIEKVKAKIARSLQRGYDQKSNLEELKLFFRSAYVQKEKCRKIYASVSEIRALSFSTLEALRIKQKNYGKMKDLQSDVIERITRNVADYASAPIQKALTDMNPLIGEDAIDAVSETVSAELEDIPKQYEAAFSEAIAEYKSRLLSLIGGFSVLWNAARIDKADSPNRKLYYKLLQECEIMNIDIKAVNKSYGKILSHVSEDITRKYNSALEKLSSIKDRFAISMELAVSEMTRKPGFSAVSEAVQSLSGSVVSFVEQQITLLEERSSLSKASIDEAEERVASAIINNNTEFTSTFSRSVTSGIKNSIKPGSVFSSRDYLDIDGSNGLRILLINLSPSSADRTYIKNQIQTMGITEILNNINLWYGEANRTITSMFSQLSDQVTDLMKSTREMLSKDADANRAHYERVVAQLSACESALIQYRKRVQPYFDASLDISGEKEQFLYCRDIFNNLKLRSDRDAG